MVQWPNLKMKWKILHHFVRRQQWFTSAEWTFILVYGLTVPFYVKGNWQIRIQGPNVIFMHILKLTGFQIFPWYQKSVMAHSSFSFKNIRASLFAQACSIPSRVDAHNFVCYFDDSVIRQLTNEERGWGPATLTPLSLTPEEGSCDRPTSVLQRNVRREACCSVLREQHKGISLSPLPAISYSTSPLPLPSLSLIYAYNVPIDFLFFCSSVTAHTWRCFSCLTTGHVSIVSPRVGHLRGWHVWLEWTEKVSPSAP